MKQYKIFRHPSGTSEAVKQGWSWPAFFFGFIWAAVKKQWALSVAVAVCFFFLGFALANVGDELINIVGIIVSIVFGLNGNAWREKNLASRGYELMDTVTAANPEGATALYLKAADAEP